MLPIIEGERTKAFGKISMHVGDDWVRIAEHLGKDPNLYRNSMPNDVTYGTPRGRCYFFLRRLADNCEAGQTLVDALRATGFPDQATILDIVIRFSYQDYVYLNRPYGDFRQPTPLPPIAPSPLLRDLDPTTRAAFFTKWVGTVGDRWKDVSGGLTLNFYSLRDEMPAEVRLKSSVEQAMWFFDYITNRSPRGAYRDYTAANLSAALRQASLEVVATDLDAVVAGTAR